MQTTQYFMQTALKHELGFLHIAWKTIILSTVLLYNFGTYCWKLLHNVKRKFSLYEVLHSPGSEKMLYCVQSPFHVSFPLIPSAFSVFYLPCWL